MTPEATFHSLRHTFVSFAANAGIPLHVVQAIVGHTSTVMTRHYYHENEAALRSAVDAIPEFGQRSAVEYSKRSFSSENGGVEERLLRLKKLLDDSLITREEYLEHRKRILDLL